LRIEHGFFRFNDHVNSHVHTLARIGVATSATVSLYRIRDPHECRRECNESIGEFQRRG
jgi:hypothetical protein